MPDPQTIVTRIVEYLQAAGSAPRDELTNLAELYAHQCSLVNARLLRASEYLRLGLLNEAVDLCEIEPQVLPLAASLDFPLAAQWLEFCKANKLPAAEPLRMEMAQQLSTACNEFASMAELYRRNTVMALANFPLQKRLANLRALHKLQPANPALAENICDLEDKWLEDILTKILDAEKQGSADAIADIMTTLEHETFLTPNAPKMVASIQQVHRRFQIDFGQQLLDELIGDIEEETAAGDAQACRKLERKWKETLVRYDIEPTPAQQRRAEPMFKFLANLDEMETAERKFLQAISDIEYLLEEEKPDITSLRRRYRHLTDIGRTIPQELQQRYLRTIESRLLAKRRKRRLITSLILIVIIIALTGGFYLIKNHNRETHFRELCHSISAQIKQDNLSAAGKMLSDLKANNPALAARPKIQALSGEYEKALERAKQIDTEFAELVKKINAAGYDQPDNASLTAAEKLARTQAHKIQLEKIKTAIARQHRKKQFLAEQEFSRQLTQLSGELAKVDSAGLDKDLDKFSSRIRTLAQKRQKLAEMPMVSKELLATLEPISATLSSYQNSISLALKAREEKVQRLKIRQRQQQLYKQKIDALKSAAAYNTENYVQKLKEFSRLYPNDPAAAELKNSLSLANQWRAMNQWNIITKSFKNSLGLESSKTRAARIALVSKYLQSFPNSPIAPLANEYLDFLTKADAALGEKSPWRTELPRIMQSPAMQLDSFETPDGEVWYLPLNTKPTENSIGLLAYVIDTLDFNKTKKILLKDMTLKKLAAQPGPSPQTKLANQIRDKLLDYGEANWNTQPLEMLAMISDDKQLDAILKANLLDVVLPLARRTCWPELAELENAQNRLGSLMMSQVPWPDPVSKSVKKSRVRAQKAIAGLPDFNKLARANSENIAKLKKLLARQLSSCGLVWQNETGKIVLPATPLENAGLYAISPATGKLVKVADVQNSVIRPTSAIKDVPAGSVVYKTSIKAD